MGTPIVLGYLPLGFAYGVLAVKSGIPALWAVTMSALIFAGAGQLIAAGMIGAGAPVLSIVLANLMVNLRHILMSAALAPDVKALSQVQRTLFALDVTDEVFAVHTADFRNGAACRAPRLFACNITAHMGWIAGTAVGAFSGGLVTDVRPLGLDYALPAMFLALLLPLCAERLHLLVALAGALFSLGLNLAGAGRWSVILATLLAATLGLWLSRRRGDGDGPGTAGAGTPEDQIARGGHDQS
ncbi:MAG: AzlC family ABC transporter permease [Desulfovibrionaceae bacterium]|nr:AzlC family ABC transporter permease [Desulfovibrionaceae bacterium]